MSSGNVNLDPGRIEQKLASKDSWAGFLDAAGKSHPSHHGSVQLMAVTHIAPDCTHGMAMIAALPVLKTKFCFSHTKSGQN